MGGLPIINNTEIRCITCFHIFTIKIKPDFPSTKLLKTCKCSSNTIGIYNFLTEYKKSKIFNIICSKCNKANPKDSSYCEDCKKIFCLNCLKSIHKSKENIKHRHISVDKYDFFCIIHQKENYCAYCKTCKINICSKCIQEKLHENHKISIFKKIYDEKKMKDYYKKAIKVAEEKINYNKIICNMISKKFNKNDVKDLKKLYEINDNENKLILETINIFYEIYEAIKTKNYALILNIIDNMDFNLEKIKFEKNTTKDKDLEALSNYFKTDFILKIKIKKEEVKNNNGDNNVINEINNQEKNKEEIQKSEGVSGDDKNSEENIIEEKQNEEKKDEENKEEEKKDEENKEEEKKGEENKEEEKKGEENKEEEKKEEERKDEEKKEEDGHVKSIKEIREMLENKINAQGGFRQNVQPINNSKNNNDIINEPKGNPENVVNIITSQTINKKTKKKPKKKAINLDI